jgi:hypothetical protein
MYNPLKYVDPSGERCVGGIISGYLLEQAYRELMIMRYNNYLEIMEPTWERINWLINSIYSVGDSSAGALSNNNHGGSGNHGGSMEAAIGVEAFKKFCQELGLEPNKSIPDEMKTDEFLKKFQETFFPDAPMEYVKKFVVENLDKEYYFHNDDKLGGRTIPLLNHGMLTGNSNVYFNDNYVFNSPETLFYTMGHEFVHVSQFAELKGVERDIMSDPDFIMTLEYHANAWGLSVGCGINRFYDSFESEMIQCYSNRYHLDYTYFNWTYNIINPYIWLNP